MTKPVELNPLELKGVNPDKVYMGDPCINGHSGIRYRGNNKCVVCVRDYNNTYYRRRTSRDPEGEAKRRLSINKERRTKYAKEQHDEIAYVLYSPCLGLYKFGSTIHLDRRISQLKVSNPDITLIGCFTGGREVERSFHKAYEEYRVSGEWFDLKITPEDAYEMLHYLGTGEYPDD